jgi:hypothetical protein
MPNLVAVIGPMVDPQGIVFLEEKYCRCTPTASAAAMTGRLDRAEVA